MIFSQCLISSQVILYFFPYLTPNDFILSDSLVLRLLLKIPVVPYELAISGSFFVHFLYTKTYKCFRIPEFFEILPELFRSRVKIAEFCQKAEFFRDLSFGPNAQKKPEYGYILLGSPTTPLQLRHP